ncbi:hypothetical protein [Ewingella americana]|uniref:Uncharacterized protein n=1 Tax=Ewingella americana TaxID=41202 RepID=A0A502GDU3_9GAMM|nr:hypothetical protein [Ewingella americana]TPG59921.1 hypothetical protein EAH77_15250 [Ewingella americana]
MNLQAELNQFLHTKYSGNVIEHGAHLMIKTPMVDHLLHICEEDTDGLHMTYQPHGIEKIDDQVIHAVHVFLIGFLTEAWITKGIKLKIADPITLSFFEEVKADFELETGYKYQVQDKSIGEIPIFYYSAKRTLH